MFRGRIDRRQRESCTVKSREHFTNGSTAMYKYKTAVRQLT